MENERNKNVELLSQIGKELTSSLDKDAIFLKLYEHVSRVGIHHPERGKIEFQLAIEKGKRRDPYTLDTKSRNQLPVTCKETRKPVVVKDSTDTSALSSMICMPLLMKDRVLGVITVQSFSRKPLYRIPPRPSGESGGVHIDCT